MKLISKKKESQTLEEHQFISNCLKIGLSMDDLKVMEYKDVLKILICYNRNGKEKRIATTSDWDRLCGG